MSPPRKPSEGKRRLEHEIALAERQGRLVLLVLVLAEAIMVAILNHLGLLGK